MYVVGRWNRGRERGAGGGINWDLCHISSSSSCSPPITYVFTVGFPFRVGDGAFLIRIRGCMWLWLWWREKREGRGETKRVSEWGSKERDPRLSVFFHQHNPDRSRIVAPPAIVWSEEKSSPVACCAEGWKVVWNCTAARVMEKGIGGAYSR